ncbi:hypothetical protein TcWFU_006730 [Taenia crassiceps]|uniref:Uncharacterized protein n=1 Tax=Taenia crassiceps TaxID=6207 RepID=A0ABR4QF16_9CEST
MRPTDAAMSPTIKSQPNITSPQGIEVSNGFRDHSLSLDKIRHLISVELQKMKKKLGNLQTMVLSSLIGSTPDEENPNTICKLTCLELEEGGSDLESSVNAARIPSSRFDHKCDRCISRDHIDSKFSSTTYQSKHDQIRKELNSLSLDSLSDNESSPESPISEEWEKEDLAARNLREFSTVQCDEKEVNRLNILKTSNRTGSVQRPLPTPSMTATAAGYFNRVPPLCRLHPLKLRPVAKTNSRLSCLKEAKHGTSSGRKSPLTALPDGRAPDLEFGCTSADDRPTVPRKSSVPRRPPPLRASLAKSVNSRN